MALHVDENNVLQPLGVKVLRNAEFIRNTREYSDTVPGSDGEIYFGSELEAGLISLPCFVETTPTTWDAKESEIMGYLNPKLGEQELTFANRPGKVYNVVYTGQLKFSDDDGPFHRKFTIPLKVYSGKAKASSQSTLTGSGTAVNGGNDETPIILEIVGPVTNPSVTVAGLIMTYTGQVTANDKVVIDTGKRTVLFNGVNALGNYNSVFPKLSVGNNTVTVNSASGAFTVKWHNLWI